MVPSDDKHPLITPLSTMKKTLVILALITASAFGTKALALPPLPPGPAIIVYEPVPFYPIVTPAPITVIEPVGPPVLRCGPVLRLGPVHGLRYRGLGLRPRTGIAIRF